MKRGTKSNELLTLHDDLLQTMAIEAAEQSEVEFLTRPKLISSQNFKEFDMGEFLSAIPVSKKRTGIIVFKLEENVTKIIVLENGEIVSALSDKKDELLGEWFCKKGFISREQLNTVLAIQENPPKKKFGAILIELGYLKDPKKLFAISKDRMIEIIYDLFHYDGALVIFLEGKIDWKSVFVDHDIDTQKIIMEGTTKIDEEVRARFDKLIPSPDTKLGIPKKPFEGFSLKEPQAQEIMDFLKNGPQTIRVICANRHRFKTYERIAAMLTANLIEVMEELK